MEVIENSKDEDIGNLNDMDIFDILKMKQDELVNHHLRNRYNK